MPRTTIVIPTYNEAGNLPILIHKLLELPIDDLHILVVDDNSPDGTGEIANGFAGKYPTHITVLRRHSKLGFASAYIAGFKEAIATNADYIVQMDADLSHQPVYVPQMIAAAQHSDVVIGSRYTLGGSVDESWSAFRKLLSWFANTVYVPTILKIPVRDATSGFRLWKRSALLSINLDQITSSGFIFQVEITYAAYCLDCKLVELPIHFPDRRHGSSKMSLKIQLESALRVWQLRHRYKDFQPKFHQTMD